jgi:putative membrane protein insertion efficiency factor
VIAVAVGIVRAYQILLSPFAGGACRFHPSCSEYAVEALQTHGAWRGLRLALARIARCHPFARAGVDPVPPAASPGDRPVPSPVEGPALDR